MESFSKVGLYIFFIHALALQISGEEILVDLESATPDWVSTNCQYTADYMDNWPYGCRTAPEEDIFPASKGYWTHCKPKICEFIIHPEYVGVSAMNIKNYIEGGAKIVVSVTKTAGADVITEIDTPTNKKWVTTDIDLSSRDAKSISVTLSSPMGDGFVLIDSISLEYGVDNSASAPVVPALLFCLLSGLTILLNY